MKMYGHRRGWKKRLGVNSGRARDRRSHGMNTKTNKVTGEGNAPRVTISDWRDGRFTVDEFRERIAAQCGQPFDGTIEAIEAEQDAATSDEDYGNASAGEADESEEEQGEEQRDDGRSFGMGESYAERNA